MKQVTSLASATPPPLTVLLATLAASALVFRHSRRVQPRALCVGSSRTPLGALLGSFQGSVQMAQVHGTHYVKTLAKAASEKASLYVNKVGACCFSKRVRSQNEYL